MIKLGPQFLYDASSDDLIKVKFTDKGKRMYQLIYLHRPAIYKKDNEYYYFDCSYSQAFQYFQRFGRNAIVIEPFKLQEDLRQFYASSNRAYIKLLHK